MASPTRPPNRGYFHVAVICALPREADAVALLFDYFWDDQSDPYGSATGDTNTYTTGRIGHHDVVLAVLPGMGTVDSAVAGSKLQSSFTEIKLALLVGICGGVPRIDDSDAFLGDVVISNAMVQYDFGRQYPGHFAPKNNIGENLGRPDRQIRGLLVKLQTEVGMKQLQERTTEHLKCLQKATPKRGRRAKYQNPGFMEDKLYQSDYKHVHRGHCRLCFYGSFCEVASKETCLDLDCDEDFLVPRDHHAPVGDYSPQIFIGCVGSGNTVLKSGEDRDKIAKANNIIAFEMEGAGIWEQLPCIVVKGICDYADSHKNKNWQDFAAATAASVARAILDGHSPTDTRSQSAEISSDLSHRPAQAAIQDIPYPPNEDVIDRPDIVSRLNNFLTQENEYCSAALWGLGGSGKTQIALNFAYQRCKDPGCSVFWVHADNEATFSKDYKEIAKKLGINMNLTGKDLLEAVRDGIKTKPKWVLILDNADDLSLFGIGDRESREKSLFEYVPQASTGTVLWTSRDERITGTLVSSKRGVEVSRMTSKEAEALLMSKTNEDNGDEEPEISQLLMELQWFPLAISQAGAYIRRTSTSVKEYLRLLAQDKQRWKVLKADEFDRHRRQEVPNSVLETWSISINRMRKESKLAYRILHVIAYIDNQNITHEIIVAATSHCSEGLGDNETADEFDINQAVTRLKEYSFVHKRQTDGGSQSYEMHKLVQEATRYCLATRKPTENASHPRRNFDAARGALCQSGHVKTNTYQTDSLEEGSEAYFSGVAIQVVENLFPWSEWDKSGNWLTCEKYMAHALQVVQWANVSGKYLEVSGLLEKVSSFLAYQGRWRGKDRVDTQLFQLRREFLGERHPDTIRSMGSIAVTYHQQGRYEESRKLEADVLKLRREVLGETHRDTMASMRNIATALQGEGHYKEAESLFAETWNLRKRILGERDPDTIASLADLAGAYFFLDRYKEAELLQVGVVYFWTELHGEKHPNTINAKMTLATNYCVQGRLDEAEPLSTDALTFRREFLGAEHPSTLTAMVGLSILYRKQDRLDEAKAMGSEAFLLLRKVHGETSPATLYGMYEFAVTQSRCGLHHDARLLMQQCFETRCSILGPDHPTALICMHFLAVYQFYCGLYQDARLLMQQCFEKRCSILGPDDHDTLRSMHELAVYQYTCDLFHDAMLLMQQCFEKRCSILGPDDHETLRSMHERASFYYACDLHHDAMSLMEQCFEKDCVVLGPDHEETLKSKESLATYRNNCRLYHNPMSSSTQQCYEDIRIVLGPDHDDTKASGSRLEQLKNEGNIEGECEVQLPQIVVTDTEE